MTIHDEPSHLDLAKVQREVRLLKAGLAAVLLVVLACGATTAHQKQKFTEIDVERLNIVEADGKPRLVLSNQARFPDVVLDGKTIKGRQGGKTAGMLFYNDKGECGGLSFGSAERVGRHSANAGLMFDQYRQDQTIGLQYGDNNGQRSAGLRVWDRPDMPLTELLEKLEAVKKLPDGPEKTAAAKELEAAAASPTRVLVGKTGRKDAVVMLADAKGRPRIRMTVDAAGDARLEFLDETGRVLHRLPPEREKKGEPKEQDGTDPLKKIALAFADDAKKPDPARKNVAIFVHEGVELLDFAGPGEVFAAAGRGRAFNVYTVAAAEGEIVSQRFLTIKPRYTVANCPRPDIIVLPGGATRIPLQDERVIEWIRKSSADAEVVVSVCTGAFLLAKAGLLDGKEATTHWGSIEALKREAPKTKVHADRRYVDNGKVVTCAGVSAGIDGSLHVVERLLGRQAALDTARYMEYQWEPIEKRGSP